jgi:hypothetical protein
MDELEKRVQQFNSLSLPGQGMAMHIDTSYLVNDLLREVQRLRELEAAQPSVHPTVATGCPFCGVEAADIELLNESLASDRNGG